MVFEIGGIGVDKLEKEFGTPLYAYDQQQIIDNIHALKTNITYDQLKIKYACKANTNLAILNLVKDQGLGIDAVSMGEVFLALKAGFKPSDILFTGDNSTEEELGYCVKNNVPLNIGSLFQLDLFGKLYPHKEVLVRVNPEVGAGHHDHCITGGPKSKFGIYINQLEEAKKIAKKRNIKITGIHSHIGSGILESDVFMQAMNIILEQAKHFDNLDIIDIGGGIGVPYAQDEKPINLKKLGGQITQRMEEFNKAYGKKVDLYIEPGRFVVANAGYLLVKVVNKKHTPAFQFIGVDSGFNHLMRPMAYGSHHQIFNGSKLNHPETEEAIVAGNLCESGDIFSKINEETAPYIFNKVDYQDILVIKEAGAYGFSMASHYNSRPLPAEVMCYQGRARLIRKRENLEDLLRGQTL